MNVSGRAARPGFERSTTGIGDEDRFADSATRGILVWDKH